MLSGSRAQNANVTTLCVFAIGILWLGCENPDGNAIVASKAAQHATTLKVDGKIKMLSDLTSLGAKATVFQLA